MPSSNGCPVGTEPREHIERKRSLAGACELSNAVKRPEYRTSGMAVPIIVSLNPNRSTGVRALP